MRLRVAARSSDLARLQAYQVARAIKIFNPQVEIEYAFKASLGDQNLDVPLASMESKGVFTQDFYEDLLNGKFDLVVHSWKDLPTESRPGTRIAATLERADVRDLLLLPVSAWATAQQKKTLNVLSSSPRRAYNLREFQSFLPGSIDAIHFQNVRGNVPTRIEKMFSENCALIVAKAAIDRLLTGTEPEFATMQRKLRENLARCRFMVLPLSINPTAAAQAALAIEVSDKNTAVLDMLKKINHAPTFEAVLQEREVLKSYGGGCHQKIGVNVLSRPFGKWKILRGLTDSGQILNENVLTTPGQFPQTSKYYIFPLSPEQNSWFGREPKRVDVRAEAIYVSRAEAWPDGLSFNGPIWTSGLKSWKRLAAKGIWVNGCSEGIGDEDPRLDAIVGKKKWVKLTHDKAPGQNNLATYALTLKKPADSPDLTGITHFFWMSGTSFERALLLFPAEMKKGYHGCGPGITHQTIMKHRNQLLRDPKIFLSFEAFIQAVLQPE